AGNSFQAVGVEVHLLVYLLGLRHLGGGGAVSKEHTVAAEGVVVGILVNPVAAVAPELFLGAVGTVPDGADGLVHIVPDKAALGLIVLPDGIPVLLGVAVGQAHGVVVLRVDKG